MPRRAVFLDRDGTLNRDRGFVHRPEDLEFVENAVAGLKRIAALGFALIVTTNQSGIARGVFNEADMHAFNLALCDQLRGAGIEILAVYYCPFHPTEGRGLYQRASPLRKPQPGMILQAATEHDLDLPACYAIGDKRSDILAGQAAGCRTVLVRTGAAGRDMADSAARPDFVAADLVEAAEIIARTNAPRAAGLEGAHRRCCPSVVRSALFEDCLL